MNLPRILTGFAVFSALIAFLIFLLSLIAGAKPYLHEAIWPMFAFYVVSGALFFIVNHLAYQKGDQVYVTGAIAALMIRFLAAGVFAAVFILKNLQNELWFVIDFMLLYLFFTVFEITVIISNLRAQKKT